MAAPKRRRLKVLPSTPAEEPLPPRPAWHWAVITGVLHLLFWLVLASLVGAMLKNTAATAATPTGSEFLATMGAHLGAFAIAASTAGFVVGWQSREARASAAAAGPVLAGLVGLGSAVMSPTGDAIGTGTWAIVAVALSTTAGLSGWAGFGRGRKRQARAATDPGAEES